jgi:hypothetical protein
VERVRAERSRPPVRDVRLRLRGTADPDQVLSIALDTLARSLPDQGAAAGPAVRMMRPRLGPRLDRAARLVGEPGRTKPFVECIVDLFIEPAEDPAERSYRVGWRAHSGGSRLADGEFTLVRAVGGLPKTLRVAVAWVITTGLEQLGVPRLVARVTGELGGRLFELAVARPLVAPLKATAEVIEITSAVGPAGQATDWVGRKAAPLLFESLLLEELDYDPPLPRGRSRASSPNDGAVLSMIEKPAPRTDQPSRWDHDRDTGRGPRLR